MNQTIHHFYISLQRQTRITRINTKKMNLNAPRTKGAEGKELTENTKGKSNSIFPQIFNRKSSFVHTQQTKDFVY